MPGSVSDSYDPEFTTSSNADIVRTGIRGVIEKLAPFGPPPDLNEILAGPRLDDSPEVPNPGLTEREFRIVRFCLHRVVGFRETASAAGVIRAVISKLASLGERQYIVTVCESTDAVAASIFGLTARDWRVAQFCLSMAEESI
jgi:hypothetical protein